MSVHIFGMLLTHEGTYSNNRGENEGNTNTLQKVIRNGDLYTTVSAEAIRYALRDGWQRDGQTLNRRTVDHRSVKYTDREFKDWTDHLDDDVLGFMHAKKETLSRRAPLEVTRAVSLTPWTGEVMHNFAASGSNPAVDTDNPIPYSVEVHHTRYQFGFALTPYFLGRETNDDEGAYDEEKRQRRVEATLEGLINLKSVGGAHARYYADYSPEVIILRVTTDPAPRMLYCFDQQEGGVEIDVRRLTRKLGADIDPKEVIVGTGFDLTELHALEREGAVVTSEGPWKGATIVRGVKEAVRKCMERYRCMNR